MPASHAGDHRSEAGQGRQFPARGSRGIADPPDSESGSLGRASRLAPTNFTCPQSILRDAILWYGSQLGATPGAGSSFVAVRKWWPCASTAVEPVLRQVSYARCAQGSTGDCDHFIDASLNCCYACVAETDL